MALHTRREFLESSMFAATAALAGSKLVSPLAAAEKAVGPNEVLRVAVIGVNGRGGSHLHGFMQKNGCEVVAICDTDEGVGHKKGVTTVENATGKKPVYYQDLRKVMENPEIDIVSIATPNHWHSLAAIWAMQAGKDVYVEKPVSHNVSEGRRAVQAARKYNRICQTGTQCRSLAGTIDAIQYVKAGKIGEVKLARGTCYKSRPSIGAKGHYDVPQGLDYDLWCGPAAKLEITRPKFHYDWHWQWEYGNGDLGNQGIHQMDIARWGLGMNDVGDGVLSYGGRLGYVDAGETANTQVSIHTSGDKTLVFEVRGLKTKDYKGANVGVIFHGKDGYVVLSNYDKGAAFDPEGKMVAEFKGGNESEHFANFVEAVRSRSADKLNADILQGHISSALCHLGNVSYRLGNTVSVADAGERLKAAAGNGDAVATFERVKQHLTDNGLDLEATKLTFGRQLKLDAQTEKFIGDSADEANPWLTREYRAPFIVPADGAV